MSGTPSPDSVVTADPIATPVASDTSSIKSADVTGVIATPKPSVAATHTDYNAVCQAWIRVLVEHCAPLFVSLLLDLYEKCAEQARVRGLSARAAYKSLMRRVPHWPADAITDATRRIAAGAPSAQKVFEQVYRAQVHCLGAVRLDDKDTRSELAIRVPSFETFVHRVFIKMSNAYLIANPGAGATGAIPTRETLWRDARHAISQAPISLVSASDFFVAPPTAPTPPVQDAVAHSIHIDVVR